MDAAIDQVQDTSGRCYRLGRLLGEGRQGRVYSVEGGRLAVKIASAQATDEARERLRQRLLFVRSLPLDDVPIARPLETLRPPYLGYAMEFLAEMEPIRDLIRPRKGADRIRDWYLGGGGLRRRLRVLARCAETLGQLHGKGLVYGDLSPQNVFVSASPLNEEVWLIDADNLQFESSPGKANLWTRGYGAPEVVTEKRGVNTLTDAYSLAVLVFETLSLVHPFKGDAVENGKPEVEDEALEGRLPWIDHPNADTNRSSRGIPRDVVLSQLLKDMCRRAFVEGLNDPMRRPGVMEWAERLHNAADLTLECPECGSTYYFSETECPWCGRGRPQFALIRVKLWAPDKDVSMTLDLKPVHVLALAVPGTVVLPCRVVRGHLGRYAHQPSVEVRFNQVDRGVGVQVRSLDGEVYRLAEEDGTPQEVGGDRAKPFPATCSLHLGPAGKVHRTVTYKVYRGT